MSKDIRAKIDALNIELERAMVPGVFTLNKETMEISNKIAALQAECKHSFVDGMCKFCDKEERNE